MNKIIIQIAITISSIGSLVFAYSLYFRNYFFDPEWTGLYLSTIPWWGFIAILFGALTQFPTLLVHSRVTFRDFSLAYWIGGFSHTIMSIYVDLTFAEVNRKTALSGGIPADQYPARTFLVFSIIVLVYVIIGWADYYVGRQEPKVKYYLKWVFIIFGTLWLLMNLLLPLVFVKSSQSGSLNTETVDRFYLGDSVSRGYISITALFLHLTTLLLFLLMYWKLVNKQKRAVIVMLIISLFSIFSGDFLVNDELYSYAIDTYSNRQSNSNLWVASRIYSVYSCILYLFLSFAFLNLFDRIRSRQKVEGREQSTALYPQYESTMSS